MTLSDQKGFNPLPSSLFPPPGLKRISLRDFWNDHRLPGKVSFTCVRTHQLLTANIVFQEPFDTIKQTKKEPNT